MPGGYIIFTGWTAIKKYAMRLRLGKVHNFGTATHLLYSSAALVYHEINIFFFTYKHLFYSSGEKGL
jgi:hypothetical protein